ncbi:MAG: glucose-1-phosphate cytidylyltransferase [Candidatus Brocadiaceae bacterium]|nr:glucose-1-phosphate cytidylyltransferase [Candidatus Brocadiaceae bacterium]
MNDVIILCGGKGSRLSEETVVKPKPMVEIGGKPILWHIMKQYSHYGCHRFIIALGYKGEYIKNYFFHYRILSSDFTIKMHPNKDPEIHGVSDESHWEITLVDTGIDTLKGGRIKRIEKYIKSDNFHLTYGDGVSNINIEDLERFHLKSGSIGTVSGVHPPSRFGEMVINNNDVVRFEEKPQLSTGIINGGFFIFNKKLFDYLSVDEHCDFEFGPLQRIASEGELKVFKFNGFWQCMDTLREREYLERLWESGAPPWKMWI